ncbi:MAG: hypothetical protein IJS52_11000 [Bacilli bacterium]|nr:hypothetical protein [Bacilli bacterium]
MKEETNNKDIRSEEEEELLKRRMAAERWVHDACLLDDYAAKIALKDNVEAAEEMLRPLLGDPKLKLKELRIEETVPPAKAGGREIRFDAVGMTGRAIASTSSSRRPGGTSPRTGRFTTSMHLPTQTPLRPTTSSLSRAGRSSCSSWAATSSARGFPYAGSTPSSTRGTASPRPWAGSSRCTSRT